MSINKNTSCCWFQSETRLGRVFIGVDIDEQVQANLDSQHRVFQQAALLEKSELFVQALELWQEIDLDLIPCDMPDNSPIQLSLTLKDKVESNSVDSAKQASRGVVAVFPPGSLPRLAPLSKELEAVIKLSGSDVALQVELDEFEISTEEFKLLENGAVVVLPKSYQSDWQINAKSVTPDVELDIAGKLTCSDDRFDVLLATYDSANLPPEDVSTADSLDNLTPNTVSVKVRCQKPCVVPLSDLLGDTEIQIPLDTSELSLTCEQQVLARGSLLNYGRGSVLAVNELVVSGE